MLDALKKNLRAQFYERNHCIACGGNSLKTIDGGKFGDDPHRSVFENSPWGENPMPFIEECAWEIVQCDCGQVFHKHILTNEWQERRFTKWMTGDAIRKFEEIHGAHTPQAAFEKSRKATQHILRIEKMTRCIRKKTPVKMLDFGCGWGLMVAMGKLFGFEAYGIDRDPDRRTPEIFPDISAINPEIKFHAITLFQVLEHLEDPLKILRALVSKLLPGGVLILETPDCTGITRIDSKFDVRAIDGLDHINAFTPKSLTAIAMHAGVCPIVAPTVQVSSDFPAIARREVRRIIGRWMPISTNQYFIR